MLQGRLRSLLLSLSSIAASSPIEAITATFILVTLTYFQLLQAIKGSEFFNVPESSPSPSPKALQLLRLAHPTKFGFEFDIQDQIQHDRHVILPSSPLTSYNPLSHSDDWSPLPTSEFKKVLEANALEGGYVFGREIGGNTDGEKASVVVIKQLTVVNEDGGKDIAPMIDWQRWLLEDIGVEIDGRRYTYQDLCFQCNTTLSPHPLHPSQSTLTLYLNPPTPQSPTFTYLNHIAHLPAFSPTGSNTTFRVLPTSGGTSWGFLPSLERSTFFSGLMGNEAGGGGKEEREEEGFTSGFRDVKWFAYAVRAFVMRFVALAKVWITFTCQ